MTPRGYGSFGEPIFNDQAAAKLRSLQRPAAGSTGAWTNHIRVRAAEVDYLLTHVSEVANGNTRVQNNLRVSTGLVFRF